MIEPFKFGGEFCMIMHVKFLAQRLVQNEHSVSSWFCQSSSSSLLLSLATKQIESIAHRNHYEIFFDFGCDLHLQNWHHIVCVIFQVAYFSLSPMFWRSSMLIEI